MIDAAARRAIGAWLAGPVTLSTLGDGHINDTWLVERQGERFVLQRLNPTVFPQPRSVARTVTRVTTHLASDRRVRVPGLHPTAAGGSWHEDQQGHVWRLWEFVSGSRTVERLTEDQAHAAGEAFGNFQIALRGLPGAVPDPIPQFLRLPHYLAELDAALAADLPAADAAGLVALVEARRGLANRFAAAQRLIHGDCKINNLLFHRDGPGVAAVIDLDTVMCGHWAWDFGDLVRSAAADQRAISLPRFAAITRGFVGSGALDDVARGPELVEQLVHAPRYLALMLGVRFLTDHLRGDRYFKVRYRGENLARAKHQLALLEDMERQESAMTAAARRA